MNLFFQAEIELTKCAKMNGKELNPEQIEEMREILQKIDSEAQVSNQSTKKFNFNVSYMFDKKSIKTTLILLFNWITLTFGNFTLLLSATKLHGDLFANYIMAAVLGDVPGTFVLIITMKYFSRRLNLFACQVLVFICCLILAFIPKEVTLNIFILVLHMKLIFSPNSILPVLWYCTSLVNVAQAVVFCWLGL